MGLIYLHLKTRNLYVEIMHLFSYGNDNDSHGIATDTVFGNGFFLEKPHLPVNGDCVLKYHYFFQECDQGKAVWDFSHAIPKGESHYMQWINLLRMACSQILEYRMTLFIGQGTRILY